MRDTTHNAWALAHKKSIKPDSVRVAKKDVMKDFWEKTRIDPKEAGKHGWYFVLFWSVLISPRFHWLMSDSVKLLENSTDASSVVLRGLETLSLKTGVRFGLCSQSFSVNVDRAGRPIYALEVTRHAPVAQLDRASVF